MNAVDLAQADRIIESRLFKLLGGLHRFLQIGRLPLQAAANNTDGKRVPDDSTRTIRDMTSTSASPGQSTGGSSNIPQVKMILTDKPKTHGADQSVYSIHTPPLRRSLFKIQANSYKTNKGKFFITTMKPAAENKERQLSAAST
jgi:hypothetical protein